MNYYSNIIESIFSYMSIFIVLSLSLNFLGTLVLTTTKIEKKPHYGQPMTLIAGLTLTAFLAWLLFGVVDNYRIYLNLILYSGFIGFVGHFLIISLPVFLKSQNKIKILSQALGRHQYFYSSLILALIFSFLYSAIWPSGQMDIWMFGSSDYFNWPQMADFWLGRINPDIIPLTHQFYDLTYDSFGTHIIFALFSVASGQSCLVILSAFMVTLLVWSGTTIQSLVAKIFDLKFWPALVVTLSLIIGAFFNYTVFRGMVGQMVATLAFATGIAELYGSNRGQLGLGYLVKKCILPVCLIFLAYPGGFFAYIGMLAIASAIFGFFQVAPGAKASDRMRWARLGVISVVVACLVSFVLAPFGAFHLFKRSMETANQTVGWLLPLINPWLLSGLPVYLSDFFTSSKEGGQPLVYLPFVVVVLGLAFGSARAFGRQAQGAVVWGRSSSPERAGLIWAISLTFLVSLIIYLLVYMFIGNRYQTWKFASFVVLPLSFVPLALFITVFRFYWKKWIKIVLLIPALLIVIFIGYHFSLILPLKQIPGKVYGTVSAETYINVLSSIFKNVKPGSAVILYLQDDSNLMLAARYFYNNPPYKVKLVKAHWLYTNFMHADFSKFINSTDNYIVISDRSFAGLFNSSSLERHSSELYVYEPLWFKEHGYVVILGVNIHEKWKLATKWVTVKVGLPEKLIGRPVKLALALTPADNDLATGQADLVIHGSQESYPNQAVPGLVEGTIGAELTNSGMFIATVKFDENDFSAAWGGKGPNLIFDKVTVEAAN